MKAQNVMIRARVNKSQISALPSLYSVWAYIIKSRFRGRERFDCIGDICLHPGKQSISNTYCGMIRVARMEATVAPGKVSEEIIRELRVLIPIKVP